LTDEDPPVDAHAHPQLGGQRKDQKRCPKDDTTERRQRKKKME
jgi:hypothetical protein